MLVAGRASGSRSRPPASSAGAVRPRPPLVHPRDRSGPWRAARVAGRTMTADRTPGEDVPMRGLFEGWHLIILLLVIVLLFGAKRLPDAARGLGRSLRIFKSEVSQLKDDDAKPAPPLHGAHRGPRGRPDHHPAAARGDARRVRPRPVTAPVRRNRHGRAPAAALAGPRGADAARASTCASCATGCSRPGSPLVVGAIAGWFLYDPRLRGPAEADRRRGARTRAVPWSRSTSRASPRRSTSSCGWRSTSAW